MSAPAALIGKTIARVEVSDSIDIRFTDGTYLELRGDWQMELNGDDKYVVEAWHLGSIVEHGRADDDGE